VIVPTTLVAPGPGRFAFELTVGFVVAGTQKAEPREIGLATPMVSAPAGTPTSRTSWTSVPARVHVPPPHVVLFEQPWPSAVPPTQRFVSRPLRHVPPGQLAATVHGLPLFVPPLQMSLRKAPRWMVVWPGQKRPLAFDNDDTPVVSGSRLIGMFPMNCAQSPPGQSAPVLHTALLFVPR
jgi:hypothetical protein